VVKTAKTVETGHAEDRRRQMDRTYRYIWHRGVLSIVVIHPVYKALLQFSEWANDHEGDTARLPLRAGWVTVLWVRVTVRGNQLELSVHPWRWIESLLNHVLPGTDVLSIPLPAIKAALSRYAGMPPREDGATRGEVGRAMLLIWSLWAYVYLIGVLRNFLLYVGWVLVRSVTTTVRSALRPIPALLAVLVVVFATGDSWRIFGEDPPWRFTALMTILLGASLAAMAVNVRGAFGGWLALLGCHDPQDEVFTRWAGRTPARGLIGTLRPMLPLGGSDQDSDGGEVLPVLRKARRMLAVNVAVLFGLTMVLNVVAVAIWISLLFIAIGTIAISSGITDDLLNTLHPAAVAQFGLLGQQYVITKPLIQLSLVLGAVAALNFATGTLQDRDNRAMFADHALADLRGALGALAYYLGAVAELLRRLANTGELDKLTGIDGDTIVNLLEPRESAAVPVSQPPLPPPPTSATP
jgi:hypothetical protein